MAKVARSNGSRFEVRADNLLAATRCIGSAGVGLKARWPNLIKTLKGVSVSSKMTNLVQTFCEPQRAKELWKR